MQFVLVPASASLLGTHEPGTQKYLRSMQLSRYSGAGANFCSATSGLCQPDWTTSKLHCLFCNVIFQVHSFIEVMHSCVISCSLGVSFQLTEPLCRASIGLSICPAWSCIQQLLRLTPTFVALICNLLIADVTGMPYVSDCNVHPVVLPCRRGWAGAKFVYEAAGSAKHRRPHSQAHPLCC